MKCETCYQEYTAFDFVTLRNLCEHVYLDSLAEKRNPSFSMPAKPFHSLSNAILVRPQEVKHTELLGDLVSLEQ